MHKRICALLLALVLLAVNLPADVLAADTNSNSLEELIAELPAVSDPLGTEYYFYNQLTDAEKVMYWKITQATWDTPHITLTGVSGFSSDELSKMAQYALTALIADSPEYHMRWNRYVDESSMPTDDSFTFSLEKMNCSSEYKIRKAEARIQQLVETVGMEGDLYSRTRDLLELLHQTMDYDPYFPFYSQVKIWYTDSALGCLLYDAAVCAGFTDTVKILCDLLNIPCITVGNAGHAWNFIRMDDGKWYSADASIDATFDWNYNLLGQNSENYVDNSNYHLSDLYFGNAQGRFSFPTLADEAYVYNGTYAAGYHDVTASFTEPEPRFVYTVNNDGTTCTITGYEGVQSGDLIIPETLDGYTVTAIGESAFHGCTGFTGNLVIADTVTSIGDGAFQECSGLTGTLHLPNALTSIGMYAFLGNRNMSGSLSLPETLESIDKHAFYDCNSLTGTLSVPAGVQLGMGAFEFCSGFTGTFYLPDAIQWERELIAGTSIDTISVSDTNDLYKVIDGVLYTKDMKTLIACPPEEKGQFVIPECVETIADAAFYFCDNLIAITIPQSVRSIGEFAFCGLSSLNHLLYTGTENDTSQINIADNNIDLNTSYVHYQAQGNEFSAIEHNTCSVEKIYACSLCDKTQYFLNNADHQFVNGVCTICGADEYWQYTITEEGDVIIVGYTGTDTDVVVPATI